MSLKIAMLASGRGSNVQAIANAIEQGQLDAEIVCLITNIEGAGVVDIANTYGIPIHVIPHQGLERQAHEAQMLQVLSEYQFDYLVLAGYMRLMTPRFVQHFNQNGQYRIVNIHPALLPSFPGTHGYEDAFEYGVKLSGITVHFVDEGVDSGPILLQSVFERRDDDTLESFKARGLGVEHKIYPQALQLLAENKVHFRYNSVSQRTYVEVDSHVLC
jgi:phosphoribosylglycinamide formyltransferase 1